MLNKDCQTTALNLLARREHSRLELERKLQAKGYAKSEIHSLLDELCSKNLQSDMRFAINYTKARADRGYGPVRIALELRERGVSELIIEDGLNSYHEHYLSWQELANKVRCKKFGCLLPKKHSQEYKKQQQFLYYRGFTSEQIITSFL